MSSPLGLSRRAKGEAELGVDAHIGCVQHIKQIAFHPLAVGRRVGDEEIVVRRCGLRVFNHMRLSVSRCVTVSFAHSHGRSQAFHPGWALS